MWLGIALAVVLVDLYIVFVAAQRFGLCPTVIALVLVGALGTSLVKRSGIKMITRFQESLARGEAPPEGVLEGLLLFAAGVAFALPGIVSDVIAFLLLVPPIRKRLAFELRQRFERSVARGTVRVVNFDVRSTEAPFVNRSEGPRVIDVEGSDITDERDDRRLPP